MLLKRQRLNCVTIFRHYGLNKLHGQVQSLTDGHARIATEERSQKKSFVARACLDRPGDPAHS